jgi:hypothetical protein
VVAFEKQREQGGRCHGQDENPGAQEHRKQVELSERLSIELRHVQHGRSNAELGQDVGDAEKNAGDFRDADVGWEENPRYRYRGTPGEKLGSPFCPRSPGQPAGKLRIQTSAAPIGVRTRQTVRSSQSA